jgi:hypothetical protein
MAEDDAGTLIIGMRHWARNVAEQPQHLCVLFLYAGWDVVLLYVQCM